MSPFVDWLSVSFKNLKSTVTQILIASTNTLVVKSITVTNTTNNPMRFSLLKTRTTQFNNMIANELLIEPKESVNVLSSIGEITLVCSSVPNFIDSLSCFSNAPSQIYDVEIDYVALKELPSINA